MAGDGKPTKRWWSRIVTRDNAKQVSTQVGAGAVVIGGGLQTVPNIWAQIAGMILIGLGTNGIGSNRD